MKTIQNLVKPFQYELSEVKSICLDIKRMDFK